MECLDDADLARFLRGQLPPERAVGAERHIAQCERCVKRLSELPSLQGEAPSAFTTALTEQGEGPAPASGAAAPPAGEKPLEHLSSPSASPPPDTGPEWARSGSARPGAGHSLRRGESVGRYLILEHVGEGGMGVVYAAWDPDLGRRVAIKLLRPDKQGSERGQARLFREAQAMARISHSNVISVYDVGTLGDSVFFAMEFVDGQTLRKWVKEKKRPWREVLDAFLASGRGLAAAHAAGVVHRDFKPENVLVGKDGRIRVTDFGLARAAEEAPEGAASPAELPAGIPAEQSPDLGQITQAGLVVGTPMYMAPEQRRNAPPDARSDQFSFCVALYWALYGDWPFDPQRRALRGAYPSPGTPQKVTDRKSLGTRSVDPATGVLEPPPDVKLPGFLRRALLRGLSPEPEKRFPSMEALLAQLEYRPRANRRVAAAAALLLVAGAGAYTYESSRRQAQLCTGAEQKLAGIWDDTLRRQVTDALRATGHPQAAFAATRATELLDDYARRWVEMSTEACRATRIRGEQTEQLLSQRVVCLERRLKDVAAVTEVLAAPDAALVGKAVDTVARLPSLQGCADVSSLSQVPPPPDSPQVRAEIERISTMLARAKALHDASRFKPALEVARPAAEAAKALGYRPLEAEARYWLGWLLNRTGNAQEGERTLFQAARDAQASHHDEQFTRTALRLAYTVGATQGRYEAGHQWNALAQASLERMGGKGELEAEVLNIEGILYTAENKAPEAQTAYERAEQLLARHVDERNPQRANILINLGVLYTQTHAHQKAIETLRQALVLVERSLGPDHENAAYAHFSLSMALRRVHDFEGAHLHIARALEIRRVTLGPEHTLVSDTYENLASLYQEQERYREALENYQKGLAIKEKTLGKEHPFVAYPADGIGQSYLGLGEPERAIPWFQRSLSHDAQDPYLKGESLFGMAKALAALKREPARVRSLAKEARQAYAEVQAQEMVDKVDAWLASWKAKPVKPARGKAGR